jgi:hypothetical protein
MEPNMKAFLYSSKIEGKEKEIQRVMTELFSPEQMNVIRSVENVSLKLQEPWEEKPIVILLALKKDELLDFLTIRDQLYSVRLILVLPDAEEGTISLAHRLRPNYLTYVNRDLHELKAVLEKMMGSH